MSVHEKKPASKVPEMECHTHETAQTIADSGVDANWAVVVARFVASPVFCMPTSMEIVRFLERISEFTYFLDTWSEQSNSEKTGKNG